MRKGKLASRGNPVIWIEASCLLEVDSRRWQNLWGILGLKVSWKKGALGRLWALGEVVRPIPIVLGHFPQAKRMGAFLRRWDVEYEVFESLQKAMVDMGGDERVVEIVVGHPRMMFSVYTALWPVSPERYGGRD